MTDLDMEFAKVQSAVDMGGGSHHGSEFLWRYAEIPQAPYKELLRYDRNCSYL